MYTKYGEDVKFTYHLLENWSKSQTDSETWRDTLDLEKQEDLKKFAKFQSYIIKSFKIILGVDKENRESFLKAQGTQRLATRWLIWSNTCFINDFMP